MRSAWRAAGASGAALLAVLGATAAALPAARAQAAAAAQVRTSGPAHPAGVVPAALARAIHARLGPGLLRAPPATWAGSSSPAATLTNQGKTASTLGFSVALSRDDTTALVGAWAIGAAYIFHAAHGDWVTTSAPTATLSNSGLPTGQGFGWSVALSADGTTALIGDLDASSGAGAAYVYHAAAEGSWTRMTSPAATLTSGAAGPGPGSFGASVALSADGTTALIGASLGVSGGSAAGAAYIFHAPAANSWVSSSSPTATLTDASGGEQELGGAVTLSADGTTALIGAPWAGPTVEHGNAYIFHAASEGSWATTSTPTATLTSAGGTEDAIGSGVALSSDGTTALVGAFGEGAAYIFHTTAEGSWTSTSAPAATLTDEATSSSSGLGYSVALSADGATALAGAWFLNSNTGAAYVFQASSEAAWATTSTPTATLTNAAGTKNSRFGYSVALAADASLALIGAPGHGSAFIYTAASRTGDTSSVSVSTHWRPHLSPPRTVVAFRASAFPASQASLALRIFDRRTHQQLYFIRMALSGGAGSLWRALPCGSYEARYHHGDGQPGFRYFTVSDGGSCP